MSAKALLSLVFIPFFFFVFSSTPLAETSYHTTLSNFQRTGFYYAHGPKEPVLNFKIKLASSFNFAFPYSVVADGDGNIYAPLKDKFAKFSKEGEKLWEFAVEPLSSFAIFAPLIYDDKIYFTASYATHHIFCLDLDGNLIWKKDLKIDNVPSLSFMLSPVILDGILYVQSVSPTFSIRAYNKDTGEFLGNRYFTNFSSPYLNIGSVLASGNLLVSTSTGDISGINLKRIFREDINPVFNAHTLYLYMNTFVQGFNTYPITLPSLDLNNNSRTYIVVNRASGGKNAKLLALNEVLQKDWEAILEGYTNGNIVIDNSGNIYVDIQKILPETNNVIFSYTKDGVRRWSYAYAGHSTFPNIIMDGDGVLYIAGGRKVFALNSESGIKLWEYSFDNDIVVTPVLDDFGNLLVVDYTGNLYSLKGEGDYTSCTRRFYCTGNIPKHHPVVLVHGLGGSPDDWISGNKKALRDLILEKYREDDPDFPDEWVYAYNYGYDNNGAYNYEGDVRMLSRGMLETVNRLSNESLEAGGDGKVDLVGFSLGGLVIRQYLANTVGEIDTTEDDFDPNVDKAILIATPNKGSLIMTLDRGVNAFPVLGPLMEDALVWGVESLWENDPDGYTKHANSWAALQVTPGSELLTNLDNPNLLPENIKYYTMGANLKARRGGVLYGFGTWTDYAELGDLTVEKESFEYLPRTPEQSIVFDDTMVIKWELAEMDNMWTFRVEVPKLETMEKAHWNVMQSSDIRNSVSEILLNY